MHLHDMDLTFPPLYTTPFYLVFPPYFVGRIVKTASMLITDEAGLSRFRIALRRRDREAFDNLMAVARRHFSAIGNSSIIDPFEAVVLSILLETEKRCQPLRAA